MRGRRPLAGLVLGPERRARHVLVEGAFVVRDGRLLGADMDALRRDLARRLGELLAVCHSRRWAARVAAGRPYADLAALQRAADRVWTALGPEDWLESFGAHPRIGEGGGAAPAWSRREQAG